MQPRSAGHRFSAVVIGAGVAGMLASVRLAEAGIEHVVLEKNDDVGGSWYENTYPGAGVDTPSYLYSYSFFDRDWSTHFGKRDEVQAYLRRRSPTPTTCATGIRFGTEVTRAAYDAAAQRWRVTACDADGTEQVLEAPVLITAVGVLNRPKLPPLPGLDTFEGPLFHSAPLARGARRRRPRGKRVAIVGTGASAMQIGPADRRHGRLASRSSSARPSGSRRTTCTSPPSATQVHWLMEHVPYYRGVVPSPALLDLQRQGPPDPAGRPGVGRRSGVDQRRQPRPPSVLRALPDAPSWTAATDLVAKALPDYPPFGKRMLLDNGWFRDAAATARRAGHRGGQRGDTEGPRATPQASSASTTSW